MKIYPWENRSHAETVRGMPFRAELALLVRDGAKTVTRRPFPDATRALPFGKAGEYCYVREPTQSDARGFAVYTADGFPVLTREARAVPWPDRWASKGRRETPARWMPAEWARTVVQVQSTLIDQLRQLGYDEAVREGFANADEFHASWDRVYGGDATMQVVRYTFTRAPVMTERAILRAIAAAKESE